MIRAAALLALVATAAQADPILSVDITLAGGEDYGAAVQVIRDAGAQASSLSLFWDDLEPRPGVFAPEDDWPAIANVYFPTTGLQFTLTLSVIDTVADRRPADLHGMAWDDPAVIARFKAHATAVLERMPMVPLIAIAVGNEVDAHLTSDAEAQAYARFLTQARAHIATLRPGLPVAAKLTFAGLTANPDRWQPVLAAGDALFATYYPLSPDFAVRPLADVPGDLDRLLALAGGRPLWLMEAGYPSGGCGAPETAQRDFVALMRAEAAARGDSVALLSFTYLTDLPDAEARAYAAYYGIEGDCFRRYLATLGLREADGTPKPALAALGAGR